MIVLAGCAELEGAAEDILAETTTVTYDCDDDQSFTAVFSADQESVSVGTEDNTYELDLTDREDGTYVFTDDDDEVELIVDGDEAELLLEDEDDFEDCEMETD